MKTTNLPTYKSKGELERSRKRKLNSIFGMTRESVKNAKK